MQRLGWGILLILFLNSLSWAQIPQVYPGAMEARLHPLSPQVCGIDIVEIGSIHSSTGEFLPQIALLHDRFDSSYGDVAPKVRWIYSYGMNPDAEVIQVYHGDELTTQAYYHPRVISNIEHVRSRILTYAAFKLAVLSSSSFGILPGFLGVLADQLVNVYRKMRAFYRSEALYTLNLMLETENQSLLSLVSEDTLLQTISVSREENSFKGAVIPRNLRGLIAEYQRDDKNLKRTQSYANLLSILNREGLVALPLMKDFVLVYYDTQKTYGRPLDLGYTDLSNMPEGVDGLIPMGIYALGHAKDRILDMDLTAAGKTKNRGWIQDLKSFGAQSGSLFLPFPFSLVLSVTDSTVSFVLDKEGNNLFTSTLETQAELLALLRSGMVRLDPELVKRIESEIATPLGAEVDQTPLFKQNAQLMTTYLQTRSESLCNQVRTQREKDFQKAYLTFGERLRRQWKLFWRNTQEGEGLEKTADERRVLIAARRAVVEARLLLNYYDESRISNSPEDVVAALDKLRVNADPKDEALIERVLNSSVQPEIRNSAKRALLSLQQERDL